MQKIMFNDKYGLTQAVLEGRKTMTRRIIKGKSFWERCPEGMWTSDEIREWEKECEQRLIDLTQTEEWEKAKEWALSHIANYKVGEIVAVAQSYRTMANSGYLDVMLDDSHTCFKQEYVGAGYSNKMFVKANLMPHKIRINNINVERLQDIRNEDCLKEGISEYYSPEQDSYYYFYENCKIMHRTPRQAFAELIDEVSGKGTWERNPLVFSYSFEIEK